MAAPYVVKVNGDQVGYHSVSFNRNVDWRVLDGFSLTTPLENDYGEFGDPVEIYRDSTLLFRGILEQKHKMVSGDGKALIMTGRGHGLKYAERTMGRIFFSDVNGKTMIENINRPPEAVPLKTEWAILRDFGVCTAYYESPNTPHPNMLHIRGLLPGFVDKRRGFLRSPIDSLTGATVTEAYLDLTVKDTHPFAGILYKGYLHPCTGYWEPSALTWNNQPAVGGQTGWVNFLAKYPGSVVTFNVLSDVLDWLNGVKTNYGWRLHPEWEDTFPWGVTLFEPGSSNPPALRVRRTFQGQSYDTPAANKNTNLSHLAIDGDLTTKWTTEGAGTPTQQTNDYFQLTFAEARDLVKIAIVQGDDTFARNWKVEVYTGSWIQVGSETDSLKRTIDLLFEKITGVTKIKITITNNAAKKWEISEIEIYKYGTQILLIGEILDPEKVFSQRFDWTDCHESLARVLDILDYEAWVGLDEKLYVNSRRGSDKSADIRFEEGVNIYQVASTREIGECNTLTVLGHGLGEEQLRATVADDALIEEQGGVREKTVTVKDVIDQNALNWLTQKLFNELKQDRVEVSCAVESEEDWNVGDYVWVDAPDSLLDQSIRVLSFEKLCDSEGESVLAVLSNKPQNLSRLINALIAELAILERTDQSAAAKVAAE